MFEPSCAYLQSCIILKAVHARRCGRGVGIFLISLLSLSWSVCQFFSPLWCGTMQAAKVELWPSNAMVHVLDVLTFCHKVCGSIIWLGDKHLQGKRMALSSWTKPKSLQIWNMFLNTLMNSWWNRYIWLMYTPNGQKVLQFLIVSEMLYFTKRLLLWLGLSWTF